MKINKKIVLMLITLLCIGIILTTAGCSKKPTASESGKFFFNFLIKHDKTDIGKFGIKEDDANNIIKTQMDATKNQTRMNFTKAGILISDEELDKITEAQYNALKSLDATVEAGSENGSEATITITTPYIDFNAMDTKATNDAQDSTIALGITDQKEAINKFKDKYIENLLAELGSAKPSSETNKGTYKFKKDAQSGLWVPDMKAEEFGEQLVKLAEK
ncbi:MULTISPECIES: hypothetical protein [Clostridium]|uniref:DUF5105 domain-containing protein n=3 Tax=Clostridium TaxID=1485 RepID=A0A1S9NDB7_CLOBE|nr:MULTISPECIES: hypothetical protein [Clostridium]MBN7577125.1 hypothetical protein [Clostridium beijerinckii]MBN7582031.1 hypothetical protein [Clostridium beijerinckii]MBN7586891.1 hypothetical protein [Clostridium beijerinckii]MBO0523083.1 hypothetical protein [Clostridium beijerinckii]MZK52378.1 hypothetical protein [Clostridium beijerinckii]